MFGASESTMIFAKFDDLRRHKLTDMGDALEFFSRCGVDIYGFALKGC